MDSSYAKRVIGFEYLGGPFLLCVFYEPYGWFHIGTSEDSNRLTQSSHGYFRFD